MSIVRIGLAETGKFADGYEAIFGKKKTRKAKKAKAAVTKSTRKKKTKGKK